MRRCAVLMAAMVAGTAQAADPDPTLLGAGVRMRPAYEGSKDRQAELVPVLRVYRGPLFVRTTQGTFEGGAQFTVLPGLVIGGQLAYEGGRKAADSEFLRTRGVPDLSVGASWGPHIEYDFRAGPAPVSLLARYRKHFDTDRGAQTDFRGTVGVFQGGGLTAGLFAQWTRHDRRAAQASFGVSPTLATTSGLSAFEAGDGARAFSYGALFGYTLSMHWMLTGGIEFARLQGSGAASPLTQKRDGTLVSVGAAWRF